MASDFADQVVRSMEYCCDDTIRGVPLDEREACRLKLVESISRPTDMHGVRLLCNCGYRGSGKSTLQAMNLKWFVNETQGIAIYITYNEDQATIVLSHGHIEACNGSKFKQSVALRILHRLMDYLRNSEIADELFCSNLNRIQQAVAGLEDPVKSALSIVKKMLGAPADTKILLCVDEVKMATENSVYPTKEALHILCKDYLDVYPWLYLSVSVYGAVPLANFATDYSRNLLLQNLPPIDVTLGLDEGKIHLLPVMLQPFYDKNMRKYLPFDDSDLKLYSKIAKWLEQTGGHGRRVEYLFREIHNFNVAGNLNSSQPLPWIHNNTEGTEFVNQLRKWIDTYGDTKIFNAITSTANYPKLGMLTYDFGVSHIDAVEQLAKDAAGPFNVKDGDDHKITVNAIENGFGSLLEERAREESVAFIPVPVLDDLFPILGKYGPCGDALRQLWEAICKLPNAISDDYRGKRFQHVMMFAVLLFTRANAKFSPQVFCLEEHTGESLKEVELLGGSAVEYKEIEISFPPKDHNGEVSADQVKSFIVDHLAPDVNGVILKFMDTCNLVSDFCGIFKCLQTATITNPKTKEKVVVPRVVSLLFQNKNWFQDTVKPETKKIQNGNPVHIIDSWRKNRHLIPKDTITLYDDNGEPMMVVEFFHILSANPIDVKEYNKEFKCADNEGIGTIPQMRAWNPTAAYACETAVTVNNLFRNYYPSDTVTK